MKIIKEFRGFSSCDVLLCEHENNRFVRKSVESADYKSRLKSQMEKQKAAGTLINAPGVFEHKEGESSFHFDMEFIRGEIFIKFIEDCNDYSKIKEMIDLLFGDLSRLHSASYKGTGATFYMALKAKLDDLLPTLDVSQKIKDKMRAYLTSLSRLDIPQTHCHGDLTFENIMHSDGKLYYIDFLDSFYSHYWFDYAKMYQDLEGGWFNIKNPDMSVNPEKLLVVKNYVDKKIREVDSDYFKHHYFLLTLTFMRILPYCKDDATRTYIRDKIEQFSSRFTLP